ncbi:GNAT family N-acetyltransferase [Defluviitalea saccharophila]|uniref:GNAT family N-acetyltransferase n=1 Tax=Defluviitalea saccharophila TaxID=879970 RepID=A0ABZ2Y6U9_9FIRM|nr:GNAT family N-acetyltransferase [Candidatus Epulonipiscium sp.]
MIIEQAQVKDLAEILLLQKQAYVSEAELYSDFHMLPLTETLDEIEREFSKHLFLKAIMNGVIIGAVRAYKEGDTCYVGRLVVHPKFQRQGIGTRLIEEVERIFSDCTRFEIFTGHKSIRNINLYKKLGYKEFQVQEVSKQLRYIYMEKIKQDDTPYNVNNCI